MVVVGFWYVWSGVWTMITRAFYWCLCECTDILWQHPNSHWCASQDHYIMLEDMWTIHGRWQHPSSYMASVHTRHVTQWAWLGCSAVQQYVPVPHSIQQLGTVIKEEWTNILQVKINCLMNFLQRRCIEATPGIDFLSSQRHTQLKQNCELWTALLLSLGTSVRWNKLPVFKYSDINIEMNI